MSHIPFEKNMTQDNNEKSDLLINIDSFPTLIGMFGGLIETNRTKLIRFLTSDPVRNEDFRKVVNVVLEVDHKQRIEKTGGGGSCGSSDVCNGIGVDGVRDIVAFILCHHLVIKNKTKSEQFGGFGPLSLLGINPFGSSYKPYVCTEEDYNAISYIINDAPKSPNPVDILKKLLPESLVEKTEKAGKTGTEFIRTTTQVLDGLNMVLRAFDTTEGNFFEKAGKSLAQIGISTGLAVVTAGAGGDNILALPTAIAKGVKMITKLFNKLAKILIRIQMTIPAIKKGLYVSTAVMESAGNLTEKSTNLIANIHSGENEKIKEIQYQMQFFYNLFSVDFRAGAGGVRCWVETIFSMYLGAGIDDEEYQKAYENGDQQTLKDLELQNIGRIKGILCLMNEISQEINDALLSFIGSAIDSAVPDSLGLFGILFAPIFSNLSTKIFTKVRDKAEESWDGIFKLIQTKDKTLGRLLQNGFEHPEEMNIVADYLFDKLSKQSFGLSDKLLDALPSGAFDKLDYLTELTGHVINKGITYMFLFVNIFAVISELSTDDRSKLTSVDIKSILTNECPIYLKAMNDLAKKGHEISKQIKAKEGISSIGVRKEITNGVRKEIIKGKEKIKTHVTSEQQKIKARADELERTEAKRASDIRLQKQEQINIKYDLEKIDTIFQNILKTDEDIKYALMQIQDDFDLSDNDMRQFITNNLRKAARASQRKGIDKNNMVNAIIDAIIDEINILESE